MMDANIRALSGDASVTARVACTGKVRVEFLRCRSEAILQWRIPRPEYALIWVRNKARGTRIKVRGAEAGSNRDEAANCWFFPEGIDAEGELNGQSANDCVGVFMKPSFVPALVKPALAQPIIGFSNDELGHAFQQLTNELATREEPLPLFTEGWAMQALAYVARATPRLQPRRSCGLAPWQLHRAKETMRSDPSENLPIAAIAKACKLSSSHFTRAFKVSTGVPPHRWLLETRVESARELLVKSRVPLAVIAYTCGFADQSHMSRVFGRVVGMTPGAWRREHIAVFEGPQDG
jgi:AraC-like DNA-binding protein